MKLSDKNDNDKGWLALLKDIFVFELIFSVLDWFFGILRSGITILRIIVLIMVILGALITYFQT